jgi:putative acetyltransferase
MIELKRTDSEDQDFVGLVRHLDAELAERDMIKHVVIAFDGSEPVACGAIKEYEPGIAEVKRMFTSPAGRGRGLATLVLAELERWAGELRFEKCILETGMRQPEAIALYKKAGYVQIANYGQYAGVDNSVCFEKQIGGVMSMGR